VFCSLCRKSHVQSWLLWMLSNLAVVLSCCSTNHVYIRLSCIKTDRKKNTSRCFFLIVVFVENLCFYIFFVFKVQYTLSLIF
jgi:hypothetical protein